MNTRDWGLLVILSILWGGSFLFVEVALTGLPPMAIVWGRVTGGALLLGVWIWARGGRFPAGRAAWGALIVQGLLNNAVPFTLFALAQGRIEGGLAAIANATTPLWTVLAAHLLTSDEKLTRGRVLAILLGFSGVLVMSGGQAGGTALAVAACLCAAMSYGLAAVWGRRFKPLGLIPQQVAFGQLASASLLVLPAFLLIGRPAALPGALPLAAMAGLIVLSTAIAYLIFFRILASAGATNLSLVTFLIPLSAIALGTGFLGEQVLPRHLGGFALIAAGLVIMDGRVGRWAARFRPA